MNPERFRQIEELYHAALEIEPGQRSAFLSGACRGEPELRREVESLLAQGSLDGVMGQPLPGIMAKVLDEDSTVARLSVGARLGPYRIEAPLGAGGMGEVYQALDTRLDRAVAIKIMHQQFSERFEREARAIAALNHPHICHLYDVGPNYLVMELVEGETLANRLKRGALPLLLALQYGSQTAGALAAAHAKGIVHRDLKPGNIMVTKSGVKVLDFGLAKSQRDETLTQTNAVIGTPKYMAPEQREGKECDARTDIYALGLVLREMAADFPPHVAHVVERCIADDPDERWQAASDVRNELEWTASSPAITVTALATRSRAPLLGWIAAGALLIGLGIILAFVHFRETPPAAQPVRLQIPVPDGMSLYNFPVAISPDGRRVAFRAGGTDSPRRLWIRELDSLELKPLPSTEVSILTPPGPPPFWSPDGRWVAFVAGGKLKKVEISGGLPQTICNGESFGGAWNRDGVIILGVDGAGLSRCPAMGGPAAPVTVLAPGETAHVWPQFLPDGRHFLYSRIAPEKTSVFVGSLDAKPAEQEMKPLLVTAQRASYAPSETGGAGWLLFVREATLMAQPFDPRKLALSGEPVPIAGPIGSLPLLQYAFFAVSNTGVVVYRGPGIAQSQLTWFDAQGGKSAVGGPGDYLTPAVSPDGTRIAAALADTQGNEHIWVLEAAAGARRRLTFDPAEDEVPVWSPDGKKIAFASLRGARWDLYVKASDGSGNDQLLLKTDEDKNPESWSGDGRYLLYTTERSLWILPLDGPEGAPAKPLPLQQTESHEQFFQFSPGPGGTPRWIAYMSDETGAFEVYARPFSPDSSGGSSASRERWMVSSGGGLFPHWRADGKQLFYRSQSGTIMAVDVTSDKTFQAGVPRRLFDPGPLEWRPDFGITADGRRFLLPQPPAVGGVRGPLTVMLNWQAGLKR